MIQQYHSWGFTQKNVTWIILWGGLSWVLQDTNQHLWPLPTSDCSPISIMAVTTKMSPNIGKCPLGVWGAKLPPVENHCSRWSSYVLLDGNLLWLLLEAVSKVSGVRPSDSQERSCGLQRTHQYFHDSLGKGWHENEEIRSTTFTENLRTYGTAVKLWESK
jgi:hypothetical protein